MDKLTQDMTDKSVRKLPEEVVYQAFIGDSESARLIVEEELERAARFNEFDVL